MKLKTLIILTMIAGVIMTGCGSSASKDSGAQNASSEVQSEQNSDSVATSKQSDEKLSNEYQVLYKGESNGSDLLTIEEVDAKPQEISDLEATFFQWKMKVRNTSGEDLKMAESSMCIFYEYLDENGDRLYDGKVSGGYSSTVENGQAEWIEENCYPASWGKNEMEAVKTIRIYGYTTNMMAHPEHEFTEPIVVDIR